MSRTVVSIVAVLLTIHVVGGCGEDSQPNTTPPTPVGALVEIRGCKEFTRTAGDEQHWSCLKWSYNAATSVLTMTHENAGFNCCPKSIGATIDVGDNNIITITESEIGPDCRCDCLFDLDMEIENVAAGTWVIVFIEPYRHKDDDILEAVVDLSKETEGRFCVPRKHYPWGI